MDIGEDESFEEEKFAKDIVAYMNKFWEGKIDWSIKSQGQTILIKIPLLHRLGWSNQSGSDLLYIKFDIQK